jgi:uncharacterized 2Fe-2S/4Fe-4S cluster protein (DUF4445 family)
VRRPRIDRPRDGWYNPGPAGVYAIFTVRFLPEDRTVDLDAPTDVFCAAAACGILLEQPCGGMTRCGRCRVRIVGGAAAPSDADREVLDPAELADGWRLACALTVNRQATIEVPEGAGAFAPKGFGAAARPAADRVPAVAPATGFGGPHVGLAVDIGTTTLAAALVDLGTGNDIAAGSCLNPQAKFGADVMSRIHAAGGGEAARLSILAAARSGLAALVGELLREAGVAGRDVAAAVVVGNPTMLHLWYGEDPSSLGVAPYLGRWTAALHIEARRVGLPIEPASPVYVLPAVRSHVGADAVAASVAVGLDRGDAPALLIDLGTNSEIVLGIGARVFAASTAAGPAFECGGISCGMRAADGAIDSLHLDPNGHWSLHVIGGGPPRGVCGSGLLDAVAELVRVGVIEPGGCMRGADQARGVVPEPLVARLKSADGRRRTTLVEAGPENREISLRAADVRQLQLAIAAVRAGIEVLCAEAGLASEALQTVFVAGTFGQFVRKASLLRLGLLPPVGPERVRAVGNAAGAGAVLALLDQRVRDRAERLAASATYVELAGRIDYQDELARCLRFPAALGGTR